MTEEPSLADLLARLRDGDEGAATAIYNRFAGRLIALARGKLDVRTRQKIDPEDVIQSAFRSFFIRQADGQFDLDDWDSLWNLLVVITLRKCGHQVERFRTARRDVRREAAPPPDVGGADAAWEAIAREPLPAEAAALADLVAQIMHGLDRNQQRIVELRLQGYGLAEIGRLIGCGERTVQRVLSRLRRQMERRLTVDPKYL
jgi:RNA polymerase sigma-70 factor (ECF subfamily)